MSRSITPYRAILLSRFAAASLVAAVGGCHPADSPSDVAIFESSQVAVNGLTINGLMLNGLMLNGLMLNGLMLNGLMLNGLPSDSATGESTRAFADWFNDADGGDIGQHANTMTYVIRCALSSGRTASYVDKFGVAHTWPGALGLADSWDENAPTEDQQQLVSACLLAHVNSAPFTPKHIQISLRGSAPSLYSSSLERAALAQYDGTFFGNLFSSGEKFVCSNLAATVPLYLQTVLRDWGRECYQDANGCGVFQRVDCASSCVRAADGTSFESCTVAGKSYRAMTVYIPQSKLPRHAILSGATRGTCTNCVDYQAIDKLAAKTTAKFSLPLGSASGDILLEVRYANGNKSRKGDPLNTYAKFTMGGKVVMNGASPNWDFAYTGGNDVWALPASSA